MDTAGQDIDIILFPEGDEGAEFRTKPSNFRKLAFQADHGDALLTRANLVGITHGYIAPEGHPATLLIFEFRFISMQKSRRYTNCNITITFEDSDNDINLCPEVHHIAPEGVFALNKTKRIRETSISANIGMSAGFAGTASANTGMTWDMAEAKDIENWTRLSGTRKSLGQIDKDDAIVWNMEENGATKSGIPSFLRAAVLLRREAAVPFNILINIHAEVDFNIADVTAGLRSLFGKKKMERIAPIEVDSAVSPKLLGVDITDPNQLDLNNLGQLDIGKFADVTLITVLGG